MGTNPLRVYEEKVGSDQCPPAVSAGPGGAKTGQRAPFYPGANKFDLSSRAFTRLTEQVESSGSVSRRSAIIVRRARETDSSEAS